MSGELIWKRKQKWSNDMHKTQTNLLCAAQAKKRCPRYCDHDQITICEWHRVEANRFADIYIKHIFS